MTFPDEEARGKGFDLSGKVAIVVGGAGFLGARFAQALAEYGARVAVADLDAAACEKLASELSERSDVPAVGTGVDVADPASVKQMVGRVVQEWGRVDVLVNSAAARTPGFFDPFEDYAAADWEEVMRVNVTGVFLCAQAVGRQMLRQGGGSIINIGSIYGVVAPDPRIYQGMPFNGPAVYSASKGAVLSLTRHLAAYWGDKGIRVNAVSPGGIERNHEEEFVQRYSRRVPMGRMGRPNDLCGVIVFLASDVSSYVSGQNFLVDGGLTAW